MKHLLIFIIMAASVSVSYAAERHPAVSDINVERSESNLIVSMTVSPTAFSSKSNRQEWLRPVIAGAADSLALRPLLVAGRTRYYQEQRLHGSAPADIILLRAGRGDDYRYTAVVPFADWMDGAVLRLDSQVEGCCSESDGQAVTSPLAMLSFPEASTESALAFDVIYIKPVAEAVKTRQVKGSAYIDFPVNRTEINPDYRRNPAELAEIRRTVDAVRTDSDVTITALSIKGFASPEGSYANNEHLARGRTRALTDYVRSLYDFKPGFIHTSWEAEDWAGLRAYVERSAIDNRSGLLAVIDSDLAPDARDSRLRSLYPEQYAFLLREVYPALRHSDYNIEYVVRNYTSPAEIAAVMATAPQKLSLDELFILAQTLDESSPEFREVMEVAVRMFPASEVANLNAASTAISHGEYEAASRYLDKAGDVPEVAYLRGVIAAMTGDAASAFDFFGAAARLKVAIAPDAIERLKAAGFDR